MKKKFLALVVGPALCALAVSGVASTSCGVLVTVSPPDSKMWIGFDSSCGTYHGTVGSQAKAYSINPGTVISIYKDANDRLIGSGGTSYTKTVPTIPGDAILKTAILDCSKGAAACTWITAE